MIKFLVKKNNVHLFFLTFFFRHMYKYLLLLLLVLTTNVLFSQEYLIDLDNNNILKDNQLHLKNKSLNNGYLELPFLDDFSTHVIYPDNNLWADKNVFINNNYAIKPLSLGVATFDGLDANGIIYEHLTHIPYGADTLTSLPIRLDSIFGSESRALGVADSIYFSFMYQPQGNGASPEAGDSLSLDFYSPMFDKWINVWRVKGESYNSFYSANGVSFKNVMLSIKDSIYLQKGFQFRFRNRVSLIKQSDEPSWASNNDQWNIDYVYLSNNRSISNQGILDISFTNNIISQINNYTSIPWQHLKAQTNNLTKDKLDLTYKNNHTAKTQITRSFKVEDLYDGSMVYELSGGVQNIDSLEEQSWTANFDYDFNSSSCNKDSNSFKITETLLTTAIADKIRENDTNVFYQNFYNYYAYDDGSAEKGYGLNYDNAKIAYRFDIYKSDILRGVEIFFNNVKDNYNEYDFDLVVWMSINPEIILYQKKLVIPITDNGLNQFGLYRFDDLVNVDISLSNEIYIGIIQSTVNNMNIGFDVNTNSKNNIFYNVGYGWQNTSFEGSLMIRPIFGKEIPLTTSSLNEPTLVDDIYVYPNPCNDLLTIKHQLKNYEVKIIDILGHILIDNTYSEPYLTQINVSNLDRGIYHLIIRDNTSNHIFTKKFVKE
ncbi:MAG: hypothetical protein A2X12_08775 [Bacteroidetes bacterium GWE2_29_8]|nr:MAG: hypothetical protein A2X12_08775 [Bacteroidetes bacterium GWE2_29_8]OFY18351.1 MAG: hypothetical protein A2X02_08415 [Bacteroidetes bacterium GWF2_29_10]